MATITPTVEHLSNDQVMVLWETLTESDTALAFELGAFKDKTVQVVGTFGGATVVFQGSNDNSTFAGLTDHSATAISLTAAGLELVAENPRYVRPSASGGTSQDIDIYLLCSK